MIFMRSAALRKEKYSKKLRALVLPGQTANYAPTAAERIHLEYCVKKEAITPMLQFSYVAFCEELLKHEAAKRPEEAQGIYNKWANRGLDETIMTSVAACIGVTIAPVPCAWNYKMKLTFTGNISATDLDDFPVLVHLDNSNFDFSHAKTNGEDIRFMDSDLCPSDGTPLKHEIEDWDQAGEEAWIWVKVPRIDGGSATDFIYMFFDNAAAADGQDAPNVWDADTIMVQHMYDNPDNTRVLGSTSAARVGTKTAANAPAEVATDLYRGQAFDGLDDYIWVPDTPSLSALTKLTVEIWIKSTDAIGTGGTVSKYASGNREWSLGCHPGTDRVEIYIYDEGAGAYIGRRKLAASGMFDGQWHHLVAVWDGGTTVASLKVYRDGVRIDNVSDSLGTFANVDDGTANVDIGRLSAALGWYFDFDGDEVRIHKTDRPVDWIMATYRSGKDLLITYGAEEGS